MRLSNGSFEPARGSNINSMVLKITLILLFVFLLVPLASAKYYTLEEAAANITIDPSGVVHVDEAISYTFDGNYSYVYRMLNTSKEESIQNIDGYCSDNACEFRVETIPEGYMLIGELPEPTPENLTFYISYDHYGAVKVHNDTSEFQKRWGEEWERPLGSLKVNITFPVENESEIRYWTHPAGYIQDENLKHNVLNLKTKKIPSSYWYDIRAIFPELKSPNSSFVQADDAEKLEEILAAEKEYQEEESILESIYRITGYFLLFVLILPILIYYMYGREPKIDCEERIYHKNKINSKEKINYQINKDKINYQEKYKRELSDRKLSADFKPAVVNAIMKGRMGIPTMDGFTATFMDLTNRGYISLRDLRPEETGSSHIQESEPEDFMIELNHDIYSNGKIPELKDFEKDVLNLLKDHAPERKISWRVLKKELDSGKDFYQFIIAWSKKVQAHTEIDRFFQSTGSTYMNLFSRVILVAAIVFYIAISEYFPSDDFPQVSKINSLAALIGIWGFILIKNSGMFVKIFGRWTPEGRLYYERWDNFKEYLIDLSAIKEHPPESVNAWDSYLVYAAALGITKKALQNMSLSVPFEQLKESRFRPIAHYYYTPSGYRSENDCSSSFQGGNENGKDGSIRGDFEDRGGGAD